MPRSSTLAFLKTESGAGLVLAAAAALALALANSPFGRDYFALIEAPIPVRLGPFEETRSILSWTRDGLMTLFFLVVGLEVKFEIMRGELASPRRLGMPIVAALGGMIGPAVICYLINLLPGGHLQAWPVPTPTDVAFSLAALAIAAPRLPQSLRVFLLTLAVADDVGAILLIAVVYSEPAHLRPILGAALGLAALIALGRWRRAPRLIYALGFAFVWACTLKAGISTSIAGLACALTVPISTRQDENNSPLKRMQDSLHPFVAYGVLPIFAFVSAGFSFGAIGWRGLLSPLALGVSLGLAVGKPLGVMTAAMAASAVGVARRPVGANWIDLAGLAMLCGAGFTMSFFLAALAFSPADQALQGQVRAGVMLGSILSVGLGTAVLRLHSRIRDDLPRN